MIAAATLIIQALLALANVLPGIEQVVSDAFAKTKSGTAPSNDEISAALDEAKSAHDALQSA